MDATLSALLRSHRQRAGLSQLALAEGAGTTQRYVSFIECGKSHPGRHLLGRLADALALGMEGRNQLFYAAGFLPPIPASLDRPPYGPLRQAAWHLMEQHGFYPALLLDGYYNILGTNAAFERLIGLVDPDGSLWSSWSSNGEAQANLLDLTFHPKGLVRFMEAKEHWLPSVWNHALQQLPDDETARQLVNELRTYPAIVEMSQPLIQKAPEPMVVERYRIGNQPLSLLSMTVRVGTPLDEKTAGLHLSLLFPADAATDDFLLQLESRKLESAP